MMRFWMFALLGMMGSAATGAAQTPTLIIVDKKTNLLKVAQYDNDEYEILKTYHATVGKVRGDKTEEGDLKTPEGIYFFTHYLTPPSIKPKFGKMAFYMDFPNPFDQMAGKTGFDIMLHSTNEPERLKLDFDSEGCIVVNDEQIAEIKSYIHLNLTPILVFDHLTSEYLQPDEDPELQTFFKNWLKAWEEKNIEGYIDGYHSAFRYEGKDIKAYKTYKKALNRKYATIQVGAQNIQYYRHPKYSVIVFEQNYRSTLKGGRTGYESKGTKILYVAEEDDQPKIISEAFTKLVW